MNTATLFTLKTLTAALTLSATAITFGLDLTIEAGYDDNPYKISSPNQEGRYTALELKHADKHRFEDKSSVAYSAKLAANQYEGKASDASNLRFDARGRWANRFKVGEKTANLLITADLRHEQKKYFSQLQRQIATTSSGDTLEDRFNFTEAKLSSEFIYRFNKQKSISLYASAARRDYLEDYQQLELESLDFKEYGLQPTLRYKGKNGLYVRPFIYLRYRHYDQLMNDNSNGRNIKDSTVVYRMLGYGLVVTKPLTKQLSFRGYLNGYSGRDNGEGYRDLDYQKLELGLNYEFGAASTLALNSTCYSKDYLIDSARPIEPETGDAGRERSGCFIEARYSQPFSLNNKEGLKWQVRAITGYENNSEDVLSYQRSTLSVGVQYSF